MDDTIITSGLLCIILVAASAADLRNHDDLYDRLEKLEQRYARDVAKYARDMANCARDMANLEDRVAALETINTHLEDRVVTLEDVNQQLVAETDINKAEIASLKTQVAGFNQRKNDGNENEGTLHVVGESGDIEHVVTSQRQMSGDESRAVTSDRDANHQIDGNNTRKRALVEGTNIAFTAYIDHDLNNQGSEQLIIFNKFLLNHGNAYNNFSGMFTAPMAGVYSFTFFIGQRDVNEFFVSLVVNNKHVVDAVVETLHVRQDLQGGNSANLMLSQGDIVFVRHTTGKGGSHVESSDGLRLSTFSGFLIYPVDEQTSVVG